MSIIHADGGEKYGGNTTIASKMYATFNIGLSTTQKRTGTHSFGLDPGGINLGCNWRYVFPDGIGRDVLGIGVAFYCGSLPGSADHLNRQFIMRWKTGANVQMCGLALSTTGTIMVIGANYANDTTDVLAESAPCITAAAWNHVEAKVTFNGASSEIEVRVNEVPVIGGTSGVNGSGLSLGAAATCKQIDTFKEAGNTGISSIYWDDLVVWDDLNGENDDFLGDCICVDHMPNANTAEDDFTKSTGTSAFAIVDNVPPTSDYIQGVNIGDRTELELPNFTVGNIAEIKGLVSFAYIKKHTAGTGTYKHGVNSGGSDDLSPSISPATTEGYYTYVIEVDPDTAAPWTTTAVQDALTVSNKDG